MAFKIRRGTDAERLTITPAEGELIYTTDTKKIYVGDGSTVGGIPSETPYPIALVDNRYIMTPINGVTIGDRSDLGLGSLDINQNAYVSTPILRLMQRHDNVDANNIVLYRSRGTFTNPQPVQVGDDIADIAFIGQAGNTFGTAAVLSVKVDSSVGTNFCPGSFDFQTVDNTGTLRSVTKIDSLGVLYSNKISAVTTDGDFEILSNGTGRIKINNLNWPTTDGSSGNYLTTNGSGELQWSAPLNLTGYATTTYVDNAISNIIDGAPGLLDTLNELAAAVADDENFATTTTTALGNRVRFDDVQTLTPTQKLVAQSNIGLTPAALQSDWSQSDNTASDFIKNKPSVPNLASVAQDILPTTDITYDLGSPTKRFRDLYLSSSSIYLGDTIVSVNPDNKLEIGQELTGSAPDVNYIEWRTDNTVLFSNVDNSSTLFTTLSNLKISDTIIGYYNTSNTGRLIVTSINSSPNGVSNTIFNVGVGTAALANTVLDSVKFLKNLVQDDVAQFTDTNNILPVIENRNVDGGATVTIWDIPTNSVDGAKLIVRGRDLSTGDTHTCEVLLTLNSNTSHKSTVYAVIHTSATPLYTLDTVINGSNLELNATVPNSIATVRFKVIAQIIAI
jgi:hypothetical protein